MFCNKQTGMLKKKKNPEFVATGALPVMQDKHHVSITMKSGFVKSIVGMFILLILSVRQPVRLDSFFPLWQFCASLHVSEKEFFHCQFIPNFFNVVAEDRIISHSFHGFRHFARGSFLCVLLHVAILVSISDYQRRLYEARERL